MVDCFGIVVEVVVSFLFCGEICCIMCGIDVDCYCFGFCECVGCLLIGGLLVVFM